MLNLWHFACIVRAATAARRKGMKNVSRYLITVLVCMSFLLSACDKRHDVERDDVDFSRLGSEEMLGAEDTKFLSMLLGNASMQDLTDVMARSLEKLNQLAKDELTSSDDYRTLYRLLVNAHKVMGEEIEKEKVTSEDDGSLPLNEVLAALLESAVEQDVATPLCQVLARLDPRDDLLTATLTPMIEYLMAADTDILSNAVGGGSVSFNEEFVEADFEDLLESVNNLLQFCDEDDTYYGLKLRADDLLQAMKDNDLGLTVGDVRSVLDALLDQEVSDDEEEKPAGPELGDVLAAIVEAISDSGQGEFIEDDLQELLVALGSLMSEPRARADGDTAERNIGDKADLERVLAAAGDFMSTDSQLVKEFMISALEGMAPTSDGETLSGVLTAVSSLNEMDIPRIDDDLLQNLILNNQDHQARAGAEIKTSALRSLIYMMQEANSIPTMLGKPLMSMITSSDGTTVGEMTDYPESYRYNMAIWTVGEVVEAMKLPEFEGDPYEAFAWVLYEKDYTLFKLGELKIISYTGLAEMMSGWLNQTIVDLGTTVSDGVIDSFKSFEELVGGNGSIATAGERHRLFSLFGPLMEYFWDEKRAGDMVLMLAKMNEIDDFTSLRCHSWETPTYESDDQGTVLKAVEGTDGYGLLFYALRGEGVDNNEKDLLDPVLRLLVRVVDILNDKENYPFEYTDEYGGTDTYSLLDALFAALDLERMTPEDIHDLADALFDPLSEDSVFYDPENADDSLFDKAGSLINEHHDALVAIAGAGGRLLLEVADPDVFTSLTDDLKTIVDKLDKLVDVEASDGENTLDELLDYLSAKQSDDSLNPFMRGVKTLTCRLLDIKDAECNPTGTLTDEHSVIQALVSVENLCDYEKLINYLRVITDPDSDMLWPLVDALLSDMDEESMLHRIMNDEQGAISIELSFIQAICTPVAAGGSSDSMLAEIMKLVHLEYFNDYSADVVNVAGLLNDLADQCANAGLEVDSDLFKALYDALGLVVENSTIVE